MGEISPTLSEALTRALALHQAGDLAQAEQLYRKIIGAKPDHFSALHMLGVLRHQCGDHEEADRLIQRATALKSDYAVEYYNRGNGLQDLKQLDEAVASYDKAIALKPYFAEAHNNRGNALQNLKRLDEAVISYDKAIALRPDYIEAYYNRGNALQNLKRFDQALASYDKAIALKPDYVDAYNNRGAPLRDLKRLEEAVTSFDKAIALKPDFAEAHNNRGNALLNLKRLDEAVISYDKAIALKPDFAKAHYNRGNALWGLKRLDEALASYDRAIALKPDYAEAHYSQSHCLLLMGRLEEGWRQYEWRKKKAEPVGVRAYSQPLWLGKDIPGKTLFIYCEQGVGDTIQFYRYGKLIKARGTRVVMSVQESLLRLLKQSSSDIRIINHNEVPSAFDYHCPMMSLPLALGTTLTTIPSEQSYILADEQLRKVWNARLPQRTKPRIGVVWSGNPNHKNDHNRSIDFATLLPLFSTDAHWIFLQKELRHNDFALLRVLHQVVLLGGELKDFSETAAVVDVLDLVITVDTAIAHLAGAMGKQVWILLPYIPDWRWLLDRSDTPWYPTARLFRQDDTRSWEKVVERVRMALRDLVQNP